MPNVSQTDNRNCVPKRVCGLDSLRFICASVVVLSHSQKFPLFAGADPEFKLADWLDSGYRMFFSGVPAVIVFFVISGFCIHYGWYANGTPTNVLRFLTRRWVRIWIPLLAAMLLATVLGLRFSLYSNTVLWSVYCEIIYYTIFPLFAALANRAGWLPLIGASFLTAMAVIATNPTADAYPSYGLALNWVLGLPCWLLGCQLSHWYLSKEYGVAKEQWNLRQLWMWRCVVIFLVPVSVVLRFHVGVGQPWSMSIFAIFVFFWLRHELVSGSYHDSLERAGVFSYSIYIVHMPLAKFWRSSELPSFGYVADWLLLMMLIYAASYAFFRVVERPSHHLARHISKSRHLRIEPALATQTGTAR